MKEVTIRKEDFLNYDAEATANVPLRTKFKGAHFYIVNDDGSEFMSIKVHMISSTLVDRDDDGNAISADTSITISQPKYKDMKFLTARFLPHHYIAYAPKNKARREYGCEITHQALGCLGNLMLDGQFLLERQAA